MLNLNTNTINDKILNQVLNYIFISNHLNFVKVEVMGAEHWDITLGKQDANNELQIETLSVDNEELGVLSWQSRITLSRSPNYAKFSANACSCALFP